MGEVEIIKVIVQGGAIGLSAGLIVLLGIVILRFFRQDEQDSKERQIMLSLFENILNRQFGKFEELTRTIQAGQADVVETLQQNFIKAQEDLIRYMSEHMGKVTAGHTAKLDLIDANVKSVPAETVRLLQTEFVAHTETVRLAVETATEGHQETIREAVNQALQPYLDQLEEKLDQMPGTEATRKLLRDEVEKLHQRLIDQVAELTTPMLDKLNEIAAALDRLQPPVVLAEAGEQTPADHSSRGEDDHVGNPS